MNIIINATQHDATMEQVEEGVCASIFQDRLRKWLTFESFPSRLHIQQHASFIADLVLTQAIGIIKDADAQGPFEKHAQALAGGPAYNEVVCKTFRIKCMIGGAPYLMAELEKELWHRGIEPVYSFSTRQSVESTDAEGNVTKTSVFKHIGFVSAIQ